MEQQTSKAKDKSDTSKTKDKSDTSKSKYETDTSKKEEVAKVDNNVFPGNCVVKVVATFIDAIDN